VRLAKEYSDAPSRAEQASLDALAGPLGLGALSKRLSSKTERLLANAWTARVIAGQLDARVERAGELPALVRSLYTGASPLEWVTHHGPQNDSMSGAWAYVDGGWRFVGAMSKVMTTPEWASMYQRLFPMSEVGLRDLFRALARSFVSGQLFFSLLTESLRPTVAKMDWFRGLDAALTITALEGVERYDAGRAKESEVLLACCAEVADPEDIAIEVIPLKAPGLYAVNWSNLRNERATAFVMLRFCDGAWRWLGGAVEHR
jgi:hypothetical protein